MPKLHTNTKSSEENPVTNSDYAVPDNGHASKISANPSIYHSDNAIDLVCDHADTQSDHAQSTAPPGNHAVIQSDHAQPTDHNCDRAEITSETLK
jgi:hypothetical protein